MKDTPGHVPVSDIDENFAVMLKIASDYSKYFLANETINDWRSNKRCRFIHNYSSSRLHPSYLLVFEEKDF